VPLLSGSLASTQLCWMQLSSQLSRTSGSMHSATAHGGYSLIEQRHATQVGGPAVQGNNLACCAPAVDVVPPEQDAEVVHQHQQVQAEDGIGMPLPSPRIHHHEDVAVPAHGDASPGDEVLQTQDRLPRFSERL